MHCVRRAALRAVCSSRFVIVSRQPVAAIAAPITKAIVRPTGVLPLSRYFSQTARVAEEEKDEFTESGTPLQSSQTEDERVAPNGYSVFISNMTFDATDVHLNEAFGKYGEVISSNIARDGRGLSRGFGFVTYGDKESADRAVDQANNSFWHGRRIAVAHRKEGPSSPKNNRGKMEPTNSIYIGNIPYEASDADLNALFRSLDNVTDVRVAVDRNTGWPRGFAHADFADVESAIKASEFLSQHTLSGRNLRIDFAQSRPNSLKNRSGDSE